MEVYYYRCPVCGFLYQVPAYWVSFAPEDTTEFPHMNPKTKKLCDNAALQLQEEEQ